MSKQSKQTNRKVKNGSFRSIFMHADGVDMFLMTLGFLAVVGDGIAMPIMFYFTSNIMNSVGGFSKIVILLWGNNYAGADVRDVRVPFLWVVCCGSYIAMEASNCCASICYSFSCTWFDLWKDSDELIEKVREEYNKDGMVAEQAISSVRTVYSFVGEYKSLREYSAALQSPLKLGLEQGLAKGIAIGSNGVNYAVWSFLCWYGSRLVMYQGAKGGTVFAVGTVIVFGGGSLGSALSNMRYFSDAIAVS